MSRELFYVVRKLWRFVLLIILLLYLLIFLMKESLLHQGHRNCYFLYLESPSPGPFLTGFSLDVRAFLKCYLFLKAFADFSHEESTIPSPVTFSNEKVAGRLTFPLLLCIVCVMTVPHFICLVYWYIPRA